jgi:hypothetical protein
MGGFLEIPVLGRLDTKLELYRMTLYPVEGFQMASFPVKFVA